LGRKRAKLGRDGRIEHTAGSGTAREVGNGHSSDDRGLDNRHGHEIKVGDLPSIGNLQIGELGTRILD